MNMVQDADTKFLQTHNLDMVEWELVKARGKLIPSYDDDGVDWEALTKQVNAILGDEDAVTTSKVENTYWDNVGNAERVTSIPLFTRPDALAYMVLFSNFPNEIDGNGELTPSITLSQVQEVTGRGTTTAKKHFTNNGVSVIDEESKTQTFPAYQALYIALQIDQRSGGSTTGIKHYQGLRIEAWASKLQAHIDAANVVLEAAGAPTIEGNVSKDLEVAERTGSADHRKAKELAKAAAELEAAQEG